MVLWAHYNLINVQAGITSSNCDIEKRMEFGEFHRVCTTCDRPETLPAGFFYLKRDCDRKKCFAAACWESVGIVSCRARIVQHFEAFWRRQLWGKGVNPFHTQYNELYFLYFMEITKTIA